MSPKQRPQARPPRFRTPLRNLDDSPLATVPAPSDGQDLASRLGAIAGAPIGSLSATDQQIASWNDTITTSAHDGFEHRVLLGLAIARQRPAYGDRTANTVQVAAVLHRSTRWVSETLRVASAVEIAFDQGVLLPLEIRDIGWPFVPAAIENVRRGRALDWTEPKPELTAQDLEAAVAKALAALKSALIAIEDDQRRAELVGEAITDLEPLREPAAEPAAEAPGPAEPQPPAPEATEDNRSRTGPNRPRPRGRGGGRGRGARGRR